MYFGFLNVLKPPGMTSHDLVAFLRKLLGQKRIGHSGTLDPNAAGVLVVAVGDATRLLEYLDDKVKRYIGLVRLGQVTDTYDAAGVVTAEKRKNTITWDRLQELAASMVGCQMQRPPLVSAVRVQGKRLYQYARSGQVVNRPWREVNIYDLALHPLETKLVYGYGDLLRIKVSCSKGTYIRSLAYDLGEKAGTGAHLATLLRTETDRFHITDSLTIEELTVLAEEDRITESLIPAEKILPLTTLELAAAEVKLVANGNLIRRNLSFSSGTLLALMDSGRLVAVAVFDQEEGSIGVIRPVKVLRHV